MATEVAQVCRTSDQQAALDVAAVKSSLTRIMVAVLNNYPWSFLEVADPATEDTVADQAQYPLRGTDDDARHIVDVKLDGVLVEYQDRHAFFQQKDNLTSSGARKWTIVGRDDEDFPIIEFDDAPTQAGLEIEYLYTRKVKTEAPEEQVRPEIENYVMLEALSIWYPFPQKTAQFGKKAQAALAAAVRAHTLKPNAVSKDVLDDETKRLNRQLNAMVADDSFGSGGLLYDE